MRLTEPLRPELCSQEIYAENASRNPEIWIHDNHFGSGNRFILDEGVDPVYSVDSTAVAFSLNEIQM